jgi:hypothetical protein
MAAPNIVNVATITGKTAVLAVTDSLSSIVSNSAGSNKVFKINALYVSNVDGVSNADVSVSIQRSGTDYYIAKTVTVPADASIDVLSKAIYLEEGDALRLIANATGDIEAVASYEEIS